MTKLSNNTFAGFQQIDKKKLWLAGELYILDVPRFNWSVMTVGVGQISNGISINAS